MEKNCQLDAFKAFQKAMHPIDRAQIWNLLFGKLYLMSIESAGLPLGFRKEQFIALLIQLLEKVLRWQFGKLTS
jgi:hypothetical protein